MRVGVSRRRDWLVGQLPVGMLDDDFFVRFTSLFEAVATTFLEGADNVPNIVDPYVTPVSCIGWLGSWLGVHSIDSSMDEQLQRRLLRQASQGLAWRGTRRGLQQFLEVITGAAVTIEESGGIVREGEAGDRPPFVRVMVESIGTLVPADFVALVADEIPANVRYELFVGGAQLWPEIGGTAGPFGPPGSGAASAIGHGLPAPSDVVEVPEEVVEALAGVAEVSGSPTGEGEAPGNGASSVSAPPDPNGRGATGRGPAGNGGPNGGGVSLGDGAPPMVAPPPNPPPADSTPGGGESRDGD